MARYSKKEKVSDQTKDEAISIANGIKKPGQNKEQTKLVAQGIQKGIELYKKQNKAKSRDLDKQLKKAKNYKEELTENTEQAVEKSSTGKWLPWTLLIISWVGFAAFELVLK